MLHRATCHPDKPANIRGKCYKCAQAEYQQKYKTTAPKKRVKNHMFWDHIDSHVPPLVFLANHYKPKRILQVGASGLYTSLFLNKKVFTKAESVIVIENNEELTKDLPTDPRLQVKTALPSSFFNYDFIFIYGPRDEVKKSKTIAFITRDIIAATIVVCGNGFNKYINKVYYNYTFIQTHPNTTVLNRNELPRKELKRLAYKMFNRFKEFTGDYQEWQKILGI